MRIVICDDHRLLLEALASAMAARGYTVEAATSTPEDAVTSVRLHDPDVLLLDLGFPDGDGLDAAREVLAHHPRTKVVVLTGSAELPPLRAALELGVAGYVRKDSHIGEIIEAIERARRGEGAVDEGLVRRLGRSTNSAAPPRTPGDELTSRERDIVRLLGEGLNTSEIVEVLGISGSTVRSHIQAILSKLGVHSRVQAVALLSAADQSRNGHGHFNGDMGGGDG
jgi:two-component system, NarL family, nitrate/nitrite response regulator NarL